MVSIKNILTEEEYEDVEKKAFPGFLKPMLATLTHDYFDDPCWIYERKLDGERAICFSRNGKCWIKSRNDKDISFRYPEIIDRISSNGFSFIVDGEIVAFDKRVTSFEKLQKRMHLTSEEEALRSGVRVFYYLFDMIYFQGFDVTGVSLVSRKKMLKKSIAFHDPVRYVPHRNERGLKYYKEACKKGWEGIIAKDGDSSYVHTRSKKWLKFKCVKDQEFIVIGYTDPSGSRVGFGALLIGYHEGKKIKYAGEVGTGYSDRTLKMLKDKLTEIETDVPPVDPAAVSEKNLHWVKPKLVCEVGFTEWTRNGKLRHPRYKGLRDDKDPSDVTRED